MSKAKEEKKTEEVKDFIQTLTGRWYQIMFKGFMYEFKFHPEKKLSENIEAIEYLLMHAKEALEAEKAKEAEGIEDAEAEVID